MHARIMVIGLLSAAAVIGCGPTPSLPLVPVATPAIAIPSGLQTRMTATEVENLVLGWIHENETVVGHALKPARIVSVSASGGPVAGIVWAVDAEGTFVTNRVSPGASGLAPGTSGTYRILDADGSILDYGFQ
jgi:hypothetical protein